MNGCRSLSRSSGNIGLGLSAVVEVADDFSSATGQPRNLDEALQHIDLLQARLKYCEEERRKCLEAARNMRGAVRVVARVRPPVEAEEDEDPCLRIISRTQLEVIDQPRQGLAEPRRRYSLTEGTARRSAAGARSPDHAPSGRSSAPEVASALGGMKSRSFFFDQLLGPEVDDDELFSSFMEDFSAAIDGEPVSILAYGASGSGKTHTTSRLLSRLSTELEAQARSLEKGGLRLELSVQAVEIYNEQVRDLLQAEAMQTQPTRLQSTASTHKLHGSDSILKGMEQILKFGASQRATSGTAIHGRSSRSHMVLSLTLTTIDITTGEIRKTGKLSFADLAGNERTKKSEVEGAQMKEAQYINKSLSALADVVGAKERRLGHVPYRNSKLTHILQDTLEDPCSRIVVIATLSPTRCTISETLNTLQFSMRLNSLALQSLQVAAQSHEEIRAQYRAKLDQKDKHIEEHEEKIRERDILLEERNRELRELKTMVARLTLASQKSGTTSEPVSPTSPTSPTTPSQRRGTQPESPTQRRAGHAASSSSDGRATGAYRRSQGGRAEDSRESSAGRKPLGCRPEDPRELSAGRKPAGLRCEIPGECSSRESSNQRGAVGSSGAAKATSSRSSARKEDVTTARADVESRNTISLTYTYSENTTKALSDKLNEVREEAGVSEHDWAAGLSIIDTWGDEVDINYHIFKVQFPVNVRFRAVTAVASLGDKRGCLNSVPKINRPQGSRDRSASGGSIASNISGSGRRNTSPREYSVKTTSPERAMQLVTNGNLPPPIDSPGHPGCYQEISSVVRFSTDGTDDSIDEADIRARLLQQVKVACSSPTKETVRAGSADAMKDRREGTPVTSLRNHHSSTPTPGHGLPQRGTSTSQERSFQNRQHVASPRQQEANMSGRGTPHSLPSSSPLFPAPTPPPGPRSSSLGQQPGARSAHQASSPPPPTQQVRPGSGSPRMVQSGGGGGVGTPTRSAYANVSRAQPGLAARNMPQCAPRIASRSPPQRS